jgi:hypothetical protein
MASLGIMQPYFFPYLGYFQLIASVDAFIVYDQIEYTKKGWINRNQFLLNGKPELFTISLKDGPDTASVADREISATFRKDKLLNRIREAYRKAPQFEPGYALFERCVLNPEPNLFRYIYYSINEVCAHLGLRTQIIVSSSVETTPPTPKGKERVLALCKMMGADVYINSPGGRLLYDKEDFLTHGVQLRFLQPELSRYRQWGGEFVAGLSVLDALMFAPAEQVTRLVTDSYSLD